MKVDLMAKEEPDILKKADQILSGVIEIKDPYEKIAIILKLIPIESFEEVFRFFEEEDRKNILRALEIKVQVNSIETRLVFDEFIRKNDLSRFLKTTTLIPDEIIEAFRNYAGKHPRKISLMMAETWLFK